MKVLIANRGEIACRVASTLRKLKIPSVAIYSDVDAGARHVLMCDEAVGIGEPKAYLDIDKVLAVAAETSSTAIHPGYGFLAENAEFSKRCQDAGIRFIGPSPEAIDAFGDKGKARRLAVENDVPVIPGAEACADSAEAKRLAAEIGYPVLLKAAAGGGGKGMRQVSEASEVESAFESASREATASFGRGDMLLEKYIYPARHIEVQVLGNGTDVAIVGDRECSLQRRYQKVVEEAPAASISDTTREIIYQASRRLLTAIGYCGAATVEFLVGPDGAAYFLEVNTRLQVEHPVTELVHGIDLVAAQVSLAHDGPLPEIKEPRGHAIEVRLNAEDPYAGYLPQTGPLLGLSWPQLPNVRIDSGLTEGRSITADYDSMVAKIIVFGERREDARLQMIHALEESVVIGVVTNQSFLLDILERDFYISGETYTTTLGETEFPSPEMPEWLEDFAERHAQGSRSVQAVGNLGDAFSPWERLGTFRMGR